MATYECNQCGMSVNATCGKCDTPLQNGMLDLDDGTQVADIRMPKWPWKN
jgi:predicted ATP-dependent serine protease